MDSVSSEVSALGAPRSAHWAVFLGAHLVAGEESKGDNPAGGGAFMHLVLRQQDGWFTGTQWITGAVDSSTFGFDGKLVAGFSLGAFKPSARRRGRAVRPPCAEGIAMGNRELSLSTFGIPQLRVGGMFTPDPEESPLEIGVHTGPIFAGQFTFDGDAHRSFGGGYEVGPYAPWLDLDLQLSATVVLDAPTAYRAPVEVVRAMACSFICLDVWAVHAKTNAGSPSVMEDSRAVFLGLALVPDPGEWKVSRTNRMEPSPSRYRAQGVHSPKMQICTFSLVPVHVPTGNPCARSVPSGWGSKVPVSTLSGVRVQTPFRLKAVNFGSAGRSPGTQGRSILHPRMAPQPGVGEPTSSPSPVEQLAQTEPRHTVSVGPAEVQVPIWVS